MTEMPMATAEKWLSVAEAAIEKRAYGQALYSMEMSVEIALKSVLLALRIEVPKVHDIRAQARKFLSGNAKLPKEFRESIDSYLEMFGELLRLRQAAGYGFESQIEEIMEKEAKKHLPKCRLFVKSCGKAIKSM